MLDKSVPYVGLYMRRKAGTRLSACHPLPDGYSFVFYTDGSESDWAAIEASVLEFDSEFAALLYFGGKFMQHQDELRRRCLFIENSGGEKIATATAWWHNVNGKRRPWLQWIAVHPMYQGLGLGKALISRATELMLSLEGDADIFLHSQTWSYKAIDIYKSNGFQLTSEKALYKDGKSNYRKAKKILAKLRRE